jgi:pimeloyl-ACP methyl ester carboxylesterase
MGLKGQLGLSSKVPYTLSEMALDALAVLDALHVDRAHVLGLSMGGMIAQRLAIHHPERVLSLISIMSTSSASGLPKPDPLLLQNLYSPVTPGDGFEGFVDRALQSMQMITSQAFQDDLSHVKARVELAIARSYRPMGILRQTAAVLADSDRAEMLHLIRAPSLVVHGTHDPLVPIECGRDTHRRILGSVWVEIEHMAHDLSDKLTPVLMPHLLSFLKSHPVKVKAA